MLRCSPRLDESITDDTPMRFLEAFGDHLDLQALGFKRALAAPPGRPASHPGDPGTLWVQLYRYG